MLHRNENMKKKWKKGLDSTNCSKQWEKKAKTIYKKYFILKSCTQAR